MSGAPEVCGCTCVVFDFDFAAAALLIARCSGFSVVVDVDELCVLEPEWADEYFDGSVVDDNEPDDNDNAAVEQDEEDDQTWARLLKPEAATVGSVVTVFVCGFVVVRMG